MIILTHRALGQFLYDYFKAHTSDAHLLNRTRFVNGNMLPDLAIRYRTMSHYYYHNQDFVYQLFEDLCTKTYTRAEFSQQLGILLHFLTDYTCVFHSSSTLKSKEIQKHMKYETQLHFKATKLLPTYQNLKPVHFDSLTDVKSYIQAYVNKMDEADQPLDTARDIYHMTQLTLSVGLYILKKQAALHK